MSMAYGDNPPRGDAREVKPDYDFETDLANQANRLVNRIMNETEGFTVRDTLARLISRAEKTRKENDATDPTGRASRLSFEDILVFVNAQLNEAERTHTMKLTTDEVATIEALRAGTAGVVANRPKLPPRPGSERV